MNRTGYCQRLNNLNSVCVGLSSCSFESFSILTETFIGFDRKKLLCVSMQLLYFGKGRIISLKFANHMVDSENLKQKTQYTNLKTCQ